MQKRRKIKKVFYSQVSQMKAQKALVVTHLSESTKSLFDMTKRFHDNSQRF